MAAAQALVMLVVAPLFVLFNVVLFPIGLLLYYPLRHWWGHRVVRWTANMLMLAAAWAWVTALWRVVHGQFWWQMVWGPLLVLLAGAWLRGVEAKALAVYLGIDVSIDPWAVLPKQQVQTLFAAAREEKRRLER